MRDAVRFLDEFHGDLRRLVRALDESLLENGWSSFYSNRIGDELGNGLDASAWVLRSLFRIYSKGMGDLSQILGFHFLLAPNDFEEAVILTVGAAYSNEKKNKDKIWNDWLSSDAVLKEVAGRAFGDVVTLPDAVRIDRFLPGSASARVFVRPIAGLDSAQQVRTQLASAAIGLL